MIKYESSVDYIHVIQDYKSQFDLLFYVTDFKQIGQQLTSTASYLVIS